MNLLEVEKSFLPSCFKIRREGSIGYNKEIEKLHTHKIYQ